MSSGVDLHLLYKVANAPVASYPFPHFFVQDVFPADFYARLQTMLPDRDSTMRPLAEVRRITDRSGEAVSDAYRERYILKLRDEDLAALPPAQREFWGALRASMGIAFGHMLIDKFKSTIGARFSGKKVGFHDETLLVQDTVNYKLGPHSDSPRKVITLLFYLPPDESQRHLGTSIYAPKARHFRCPGGPHYNREDFDLVWTMPFLPNSLFAFVKTDNSFHGVEPVTDPDTRRWLLLYDVFYEEAASQ